ncbi:MAG TPA: AsmA-like C-terminal region-containing protein [Candidatus Sulfotelmatobacter sp.]|nr:AsmA-like C-terminal region-containing protein [Candidatus Sulfotelmatobacter sp.]
MGEHTHFWTKWRTRFRLCRICVWLVILALVCVVIWLNQIGLPDFAKRPIVDALRQNGIALEFVRLRLNFVHGLEADNVHIGGESTNSPSLWLKELQLQINYSALLHRKLQLDGVVLRQGKFVLPISASNEPPCALIIDHIQTELRFETNDVWTLDNFQANFAGAQFILAGSVANASAVSDWGMFHGKRGLRGASQSQLRKIGTTLSEIHFNKNSQLRLNVHGDARHINSFFAFLTINAPGTQTPWGSADNMELVAHTTAPMRSSAENTAPPLEVDWKAQLGRLKLQMGGADYVYCAGSWHASGEIDWEAEVARLQSEKLDADYISCAGFWRAPEVEVTNLFARLGGGQLSAAARLNVNTREFSFTNSSCFNLQAVVGLMTEKGRDWLDQFSLPQPPELRAGGSLIFPRSLMSSLWTNDRSEDWQADVQPSVRLAGELAVTNPTVRGFSLDRIHGWFAYSNEIWTVSDSLVTRAASRLRIQGQENGVTRDYQFHIRGALSPDIVRPYLEPKAAREFRHFVFPEPLVLDTRIKGRIPDYDSIIAEGHVAITNCSLHGETVDSAEADFHYAHQVIEFLHPHLEAGVQKMHGDAVRVDWPADRVYFVNAQGTAYPQAIATAIGPLQERIMEPYHFLAPANAIVNGYAPMRNPINADLYFKTLKPVQLEILHVRTPAMMGEIHWAGQTLVLSNLTASLYGGTGTGGVNFDFTPHGGAYFSFVADLQDVNLDDLAVDLSTPSNHLDHLKGDLTGHFVVTSGYSTDWRSCNGYGDMKLRNGPLWDVPAFGVLSPTLNMISPGLGYNRATDATAQFFMTNGVIVTDNLRIHTTQMLLYCNGTVSLKGDLNGHITSQLLHDVPGIGALFTFFTVPAGKLFEWKVTGTWDKPKARLEYLNAPQKVLQSMLHPVQFLESLETNKSRNNTPQQQPK